MLRILTFDLSFRRLTGRATARNARASATNRALCHLCCFRISRSPRRVAAASLGGCPKEKGHPLIFSKNAPTFLAFRGVLSRPITLGVTSHELLVFPAAQVRILGRGLLHVLNHGGQKSLRDRVSAPEESLTPE